MFAKIKALKVTAMNQRDHYRELYEQTGEIVYRKLAKLEQEQIRDCDRTLSKMNLLGS